MFLLCIDNRMDTMYAKSMTNTQNTQEVEAARYMEEMHAIKVTRPASRRAKLDDKIAASFAASKAAREGK